ncbi:hypothetical protein [Dongia sp.]
MREPTHAFGASLAPFQGLDFIEVEAVVICKFWIVNHAHGLVA